MPITFIDKRRAQVASTGITITGGAVYDNGALVSKVASSPTSENIEGAKDFLISIGKPGAYSANDNDYQKQIGVYKDYHILIKHSPFTVFPKIKEPVRQTWKDENGDDVWLPIATRVVSDTVKEVPSGDIDKDTTNKVITVSGLKLKKSDLEEICVIDRHGIKVSVVYNKNVGTDNISEISYTENGDTVIKYSNILLSGSLHVTYHEVLTEIVPLDLHDAFDFEPTFVYFRKSPSNENEAKNNIASFVNAIKGRWLRIFDEYTGIGYDGVYLDSTDQDPKFKKRNYDHVEFSLHFRINGTLTTVPFKN